MMPDSSFSQVPNMHGVHGLLRENEVLSAHTTWRVGGRADWMFQPRDKADLVRFLSQLPDSIPVTFIGLGSNLLVRDKGVRGVVVRSHRGLTECRVLDNGGIYIEAGVACAQAARFCNRCGYVGAEFLAGIPGTMGGALAMNAGAFGGETYDIVEVVELVDHRGNLSRRPALSLEPAYRHVKLPEGCQFTAAWLRLAQGDSEFSRRHISELLKKRGDTQPVQSANAGSVFKNPTGDHAARLIDSIGLKGLRVGGAEVSRKHANFIINSGDASAADIECLIERVRSEVQEKTGVLLETEVRIIGEA